VVAGALRNGTVVVWDPATLVARDGGAPKALLSFQPFAQGEVRVPGCEGFQSCDGSAALHSGATR